MGASGVCVGQASSHPANGIGKSWWLGCAAIIGIAAIVLLKIGRSPICPCGTITLWQGVVQSAENSQQLTDWYSLSHVVHGLIFYSVTWIILRRQAVGLRLTLATLIEAGWEVLENSPLIIDRYRAVTMAYGYSGDSVLNSMSDIACMIVGFTAARRLPWWASVGLGLALEGISLFAIRDNLTLNILMLIAPSDAIRHWQGG